MRLSLGLTPKSFFNLGGASNDADAQAFIDAAGITDATQKSAVNQLVLDLKSANIWTKMKAIYPIVGGTASTHKWNLKDPRDLDAAFRLTFSTGWTHASTGMTPNGTSAYSNTFLNVNTLTQDSNHFSYYSRTNSQTGHDAGAVDMSSSPFKRFELLLRYTDNNSYNTIMSTTQTAVSVTDSKAFWIMSRTTSSQVKQFKNNTLFATSNQTSIAPFNKVIYLGQSNGQSFWSNKQVAFASIGDGLTDAEAANFYTAVNTYQTTLGRNI